MISSHSFLQAYLFSFILWFELALGCLGLYMIHPLVGGQWGVVLQPLFRAGLRSIWLLALLFIPILLGATSLFPWLDPAQLAASSVLQKKVLYLNLPFFTGRAFGYFACWLWLVRLLLRPRALESLRRLCAGGLVLYSFTVSFALIDWVMSLETEWFSTLFAMLMIVTQGFAAMAFCVAVAMLLVRRGYYASKFSPQLMRDLGNLLLVFMMLWGYLSFMQYLIQWSGNLPVEVEHYRNRTQGGWQWLVLVFFLLQFCCPFLAILFRRVKQRQGGLALVTGLMITGVCCNIFWVVKPMFSPGIIRVSWLDLAISFFMGAVWLAVYARNLATEKIDA